MSEPSSLQVRATRPLRVLMVHNVYQHRGGEDSVVEAETDLLRQHGHEVLAYQRHNDELEGVSKLDAATQALWSRKTTREVGTLLASQRFDIVHCHNTFPLLSPSVYWAASNAQVPVVQTLHNFRLLCPQAMFLRDGRICEDCLGHLPWRAVVHACYRGSRAQSAVAVATIGLHRAIGSYANKVSRYIALSEFSRDLFVKGGLPAERIVVKPNFVDRPEAPTDTARSGFLFVGRLSKEKGLAVMAQAARQEPTLAIRVAGDGPDASVLHAVESMQMRGSLPAAAVFGEMTSATALLMPSIWYEGFPRTLVEAFSCGLPVIGSRLGAMAEWIEHGVTGLLFEPGNSTGLAGAMRWAADHPQDMRRMGVAAREVFERRLGAASNYEHLMAIYAEAIATSVADNSP